MGGASVPRLAVAAASCRPARRPGRCFPLARNNWAQAWTEADKQPLPMPLQSMIAGPVLAAATEARRKDIGPGFAGQGMGLIKAIRPAREVLEDLVAGAEAALARADCFR